MLPLKLHPQVSSLEYNPHHPVVTSSNLHNSLYNLMSCQLVCHCQISFSILALTPQLLTK